MSIKDIQDSLNNVNSISTRVDSLEKSLYLKNIFSTLYHDKNIKVYHIFFDKTKRNDFIEVYFKISLEYEDINNSKYFDTNIILYNMENGNVLFSKPYHNHEYKNILNDSFIYNFDINIEKLKIVFTFSMTRTGLNITYSSINSNRLIVKHYGN